MARKAPKHIIRALEEAHRLASLRDAAFGMPYDLYVRAGTDQPPVTLDFLVKEATRLHRETWVLPLLAEVIQWAKGEEA